MHAPNIWIFVGDFGRDVLDDLVGERSDQMFGRKRLAEMLLPDGYIKAEQQPVLAYYPHPDAPPYPGAGVLTIDRNNPTESFVQGFREQLTAPIRGGNYRRLAYLVIPAHAPALDAPLQIGGRSPGVGGP